MHTLSPTLILSLVGLMLVLSAVFCAAETAVLSASRARLHQLARHGHRRAVGALTLLQTPDKLLATIVLVMNTINIASSTLTTAVMVQLFGPVGVAYATGAMAVAILLLGEALPKAIGTLYPEPITLALTPLLLFLQKIFRPVLWAIRHFNRLVLGLFGLQGQQANRYTEADLLGAIHMAHENHVITRDHHHMLATILDLDELTVADAMVHRSAIQSIDIATPPAQVHARLAQLSRSRLPVYEGNSEHVIGILHVRDYLAALAATPEGKTVDLRSHLRKPYFVPETNPLGHQLREFLKNHVHIALVVDEYGDLQGLLSLEDILEEIVGDITDEHERARTESERQADGSIILPGRLPVRDANRRFGWKLPEDDAVTLAGLMADILGHLPAQGEKVEVSGYHFTAHSKRGHRLEKIRITPPAPAPKPGQSS